MPKLPKQDPSDSNMAADQSYRVRDLVVWQTSIPDVRHAFLPSERPNPIVFQDMVVVAILSPGCICGLDKITGEVRWLSRLDNMGTEIYSAKQNLYCLTSQALYRI